jgi:hypothetical protein
MANSQLNGTYYQSFFSTSSGGTGKSLGFSTSLKVSKEGDSKSSSSKDSGNYKYSSYGKQSISLSTEALYSWDLSTQSGYTNLDNCWRNRIPIWIQWGHVTTGSTVFNWVLDTTKPYDQAFFIITKLDLTCSDDDYMSYSADFQLYSLT